jgi:ABC-2 type transport system ATP-binding protein
MQHALLVDRVTKRFGDFVAVNEVSLAVPTGTIYGFLGPNGAGKTTTIRMVMSILYPDQGTITVLGNPVPEAVKDRLGYLPEEKGLYKKMKTGELITYFGRLKGMNGHDAKRRSVELLQRFGLGDWVDKKCDTLSKGMGQKVQILATLVHNPELVILDEPFSGLDPVNVELVRDLILALKHDGRTVIFSTHVMEQAEQICDKVLLIHRGRKILDGTLREVKSAGPKTVIVDYDGGNGRVFDRLPGVTRVNDAGKHAELTLDESADPPALLRHLVGLINISRFDTREPSLHEIFVRAVGGHIDE